MAGKNKPAPRDDSVYRVKHISRSAWEEGALSLPGLTPRDEREDEPALDDVAMDMAMTGEIPLELIRDMLRAQEESQARKQRRGSAPGPAGMIRPEEIVPARAEAAAEAPTPEEIEAAKEELWAMRARSALPQAEEEKEPKTDAKKLGRKRKKALKMREAEASKELAAPAPAAAEEPARPETPEPAIEPIEPADEEAPDEAQPREKESRGLPSLLGIFALLARIRQGRPGFLDDGAPLYRVPLAGMGGAIYRSLYYYGLRFVRPLRMAAGFALPHLAVPVLTLWHLMRAAGIALHHITVGQAMRTLRAARETHIRRREERADSGFFPSLRGWLKDYFPILYATANIAAPLAALLVLLLVIQSVSGATYALKIVDYNGNELGHIAGESVYLQAQAAANRHIAPLPETASEEEPDAGPGQSFARFEIARVRPEQLTSVDILTDQLLENAPREVTSAFGIYISDADGGNRRLFATIQNSTDAESVLTSIKNMQSANLQVGENAALGFVQQVDLVQGFYPTDQLVDAQTLLKLLTQPERAETAVTLREGDSIGGIQNRYGISLSELYALNPGLQGNEEKLKAGDEIIVLREMPVLEVKVIQTESRLVAIPYETIDTINSKLYRGEVRVRVKGEAGEERVTERVTYVNGARVGTPEEIGRVTVKAPVAERRELGSKSAQPYGNRDPVNVQISGFTWPVPDCHRISSPYGYRGKSFHKGIDIADGNTNGKIVVAAKDGTVELIQLGGSSYGNMILINHGDGSKTRYAHLMSGSISVRQGESVGIGQPIARVGSTGNSTGPHLHFEVIVNGSTQNPRGYVNP